MRVHDPFFEVVDNWSVRRLAFDSDMIELKSLGAIEAVEGFLRAMGPETANVPLGSTDARVVEKHLNTQSSANPQWLIHAAEATVKVTEADFEELKKTESPSAL